MARYGYIKQKEDIKFLVLHAMQFLSFPVTFEAIVDICTWCDDGFNFFELSEAFQEMVVSGHIKCEDDLYIITKLGLDAAVIFEKNLPYTVREAAHASALRVSRKIHRDATISTKTTQLAENDLLVSLSLKDVFSIEMSVVSRSQGLFLEKNFRKHAEKIYNTLLNALIDDYSAENNSDESEDKV